MSETGAVDMSPLPPDEWGDAEYAAYGSLLGLPGEEVPRAGSGHPYDPMNFSVVRTFVRHPALAKAFWRFNGYQLQRNSLPLRLRELAILRVAHRRQCAYEWGQHVKIARDGRITDDEIARLALGNEGFDGADLLVLRATDALLIDGRIEPSLLADGGLDTHQVMDLIFLVGSYSTLAAAFETWQLEPEPDTAPLPPASSTA